MLARAFSFLQKLGNRFGVDLVYLASGGFWISFRHVAVGLLLLIVAVAFANLLPAELYGTYQYILAAAVLIAIPTLGGLNQSVSQAVAAGKERTVLRAFLVKFRFGLIGTLIAGIGSAYYLYQGNFTLSACFAVLALLVPFMEAFGLYATLLAGRKDFKRGAWIQLSIQTAVTVALVVALFLTNNVIVFVSLYFLLWTFGRFLAWRALTENKQMLRGGEDEESMTFGKHMSVMNAVATAAQYADRVLLFQLIGGAQVALYTIALAIPEQIKGFFKNSFELLLPRYSAYSPEAVASSIWKKFWVMSAALLLVIALYIFLAPLVLGLLFPLYPDAVFYSQLFVLSEISIATGIFTTALQAEQRTKELYVVNVATALSQIIAVTAGIFFFGILGAVVGRMVARAFSSLVIIGLYIRMRR